MGLEARLIRRAAASGLAVPTVLLDSDDPSLWGSAGIVMDRVEGETLGRRILRDPDLAEARSVLAQQCGRFLAGLHAFDPDSIEDLPENEALTSFRQYLDQVDEPSPTFELAYRWLVAHRPNRSRRSIVHGDFRLGNLIVGPDGLRAVLDWELAHVGDPMEDLGYLCVRAWRFGAERAVGGFADRDELISSYSDASGVQIDPAELHWWEVVGTLKWGLGCMKQAQAHLQGFVRSVELAAIGRRICEQEWDLLGLLVPSAVNGHDMSVSPLERYPLPDHPGLHGRPTLRELVVAVREFLSDEIIPSGGASSYHARVAANVLAIVERELGVGSGAERRAADLARLAVPSESELAEAIRSGQIDYRSAKLHDVLISGVLEKVWVANPRYLAPGVPY